LAGHYSIQVCDFWIVDTYTNVNDMSYVGVTATTTGTLTGALLRGNKSPIHISRSREAKHLRSVAAGRPDVPDAEVSEAMKAMA